MSPLLISFKWEEDEGMRYDQLIDQLSSLGAYDVDQEEIEREPTHRTAPKPKKKEPPYSPPPLTLADHQMFGRGD